jgi:PAS domain S-box-containing protein
MPQVKRPATLGYAVAVLSVALAAIITWLISPLNEWIPFTLFYVAVLLSTLYGGRGAGLLATALSALLIAYLFLFPTYWLAIGLADLLQLGIFLFVALLISSLTNRIRRAEATARESKDRLKQALEASGMGIWEWNIQTGKITWSDTLEPLHGLARGAFVGNFEAYNKLIHPEDMTLFNEGVTRAVEQGADYDLEFRIVWPDGSVHWVEGKGRAFHDDAGKPLRMSGLALDITDRKQAEEALRASQERYRAFVANSSEGIWRFELDEPVSIDLPTDEQIDLCYKHGYLAECNNAMAEMYGFSRAEEIVGARLGDLLVREDPNNIEYLRAFINSGYRLTEAESHEVDREGKQKYFLNNLVGVVEGGKIMRAWGTQRDVTERKISEESLRESEARFRRVVESNIIGVSFSNINGEITDANDAYLQMLGLTREELLTGLVRWDEMTPPEYAHLDKRAIEEIKARGVCTPFEKEHVRRDGTRVPVLISSARLDESSEHCVCFIVDLTEQKRAEEKLVQLFASEQEARIEAENANRTKDEFLATLSHELRTPLTAMLGWTRMLRHKELDEATASHALETVERNAKAQAQLIEDLLDVSRIISGKLRLDVRPVRLVPIIEAALDSVRPAADAKTIQLQTMLDPMAGLVSGDAARLQQIAWNLLANAVKFTQQGGHVSIRLERADSHAEITVSDTGQGINAEFLPFVFDRFRQADSSTTRAHGGLGLGLAIVRHLVELHGGVVQAESQGEGQGATFKVKIPLVPLPVADFGLTNEEPAAKVHES